MMDRVQNSKHHNDMLSSSVILTVMIMFKPKLALVSTISMFNYTIVCMFVRVCVRACVHACATRQLNRFPFRFELKAWKITEGLRLQM